MLFEFQTQVARLLGTDVANASMYDGSTACWEAIVMARRITRRGKAILSSGLHPHYVSVAATMAKFTGDVLESSAPRLDAAPDTAALINRIDADTSRSEEHTSELQSLMRISYDFLCLTNKQETRVLARIV